MLEKRDIINYKKLGYAQGGLGVAMIFLSFVAGVSARFNMTFTHLYEPYWLGIILVLQGVSTVAASRLGKRWPLAFWAPLFALAFVGIGVYYLFTPLYKAGFYDRFPCIMQKNLETQDTRCNCSFGDDTEYLYVSGATTLTPCVRALNVINITSNLHLLLAFVALIPELLTLVLVCNDLCCLHCRRAALVPQIAVAGGTGCQPGQYVTVVPQVITVRTDEQPGSSSGNGEQAGPLPSKPANPADVPHSF